MRFRIGDTITARKAHREDVVMMFGNFESSSTSKSFTLGTELTATHGIILEFYIIGGPVAYRTQEVDSIICIESQYPYICPPINYVVIKEIITHTHNSREQLLTASNIHARSLGLAPPQRNKVIRSWIANRKGEPLMGGDNAV